MSLNKILRWLIYVGLFSITLVPLIVTPNRVISLSMFFPFITGKNFFFRIMVEIVFGLWLILAYRDKTARPKSSWILWSLLAYLGVMTIATIFGQYPERSFWSNFERMEGLIAYIHSFLFFFVSISVLKTREIWRRLFQTSIGVSLAVSWLGLLQLFGKAEIHQSGTRLDASLGNSAYMAVYMLFHIFLSGYLLATTKNKSAKWIYGAIIALESVMLYYTATRGAILGAIGGAILISLIVAWKSSGKAKTIALSGLGVILALVVVFIAVRDTAFVRNNQVLSRFANLSLSSDTLLARKQIWSMSWQGFKERPLLGWGPENYPLVFQKYYSPEMYGQEPWFDRSHNIALDNLINAGILGLLAYLAVFISGIYYIWKNGRNEREKMGATAILIGLLAGYFFQNLTVFDQLVSIILFYSILAYVHFIAVESEKVHHHEKNTNSEEGGAWLPFVVLGSVILTVGSLYYFNYRGIQVSKTLILAITPSQDPAYNLSEYQKIFAYNNVMGLVEAREQLLNSAGNAIRNQAVPEQVKQGYLALVSSEMQKQFAEHNSDARTHLFYGTFFQGIGQIDLAIPELEKALALAPKKQPIMIQLGSAYFSKGENQKGLQLFKQAYELEPEYLEAQKLYVLALLYSGQNTEADKVMGENRAAVENDDRFINYYAQKKQYSKIIEIWKNRVAQKPDDKQTIVSLAGAYYFAGDKASAIRTIQDFMKKDPSFEKEGNDLIKQIQTGKAQ